MSNIETTKVQLLPVFLVIDTSASMNSKTNNADNPDETLIDIANRIVPELVEKCQEYPSLHDRLRLSLIEFNSTAKVVVGLSDSDSFIPIPTLQASGNTSYTEAFKLIRTEIVDGLGNLKSPDVELYRPTVFFITDGDPNDSKGARDAAWTELTDKDVFPMRPNFFSFGVASATEAVLSQFSAGHGIWAIAKEPQMAATALGDAIEKMVTSVMVSGMGGGTSQITIDPDDLDSDLWAAVGSDTILLD